MATIIPGQFRTQEQHFGYYAIPNGIAANIFVRRKIGEPVDYLHRNSRKLSLQRQRFSKAAKDWSKLSYWQREEWRKTIGYRD